MFSLAGWVERCCRLDSPYAIIASSVPAVRSKGIWWHDVYGKVWVKKGKEGVCLQEKERKLNESV